MQNGESVEKGKPGESAEVVRGESAEHVQQSETVQQSEPVQSAEAEAVSGEGSGGKVKKKRVDHSKNQGKELKILCCLWMVIT